MSRGLIIAVLVVIVAAVAGVRSAIAEKKALLSQAPDKYTRMTNPVRDEMDAFEIGKRIYTMKCAKCHEANDDGERRGPALDTKEVKTAAPGTLYWVLENGNGDMPSFAKYPGKYRWQLITFLQRR